LQRKTLLLCVSVPLRLGPVHMKTLIVLPARNEAQVIGRVLDQIRLQHPELPILVVNDASQDDTVEVVQKYSEVSLIQLPFWMGYGGALQAAYKYAFRNDYDALIQMDADGQHDPKSISDLLAHLKDADVVVGSRFLEKNSYSMSFVRRSGCRVLSFLGRWLAGMQITDPTSGFQALSRKALGIAIQDYYPMDYPDLDVLILLHRFQLKVVEIPVKMYPAAGKTGMHEGLQVWYYALKMFLSILVMMLRKS
jgi:glycosyltransferase involved in cell wall biosynthesis